MIQNMPSLSHQEQQAAVEKIQEMMSKGISTAEAIKIVSAEIRKQKEQDNIGLN